MLVRSHDQDLADVRVGRLGGRHRVDWYDLDRALDLALALDLARDLALPQAALLTHRHARAHKHIHRTQWIGVEGGVGSPRVRPAVGVVLVRHVGVRVGGEGSQGRVGEEGRPGRRAQERRRHQVRPEALGPASRMCCAATAHSSNALAPSAVISRDRAQRRPRVPRTASCASTRRSTCSVSRTGR